MTSQRILYNLSQVVTCAGPGRARRGSEMADAAVLSNVAVATDGPTIVAVGPLSEMESRCPAAERIDCHGGVLMPGLVDSHTHAIFGKPRHEEHEQRAAGMDYMAIAAAGGGIHASVRDVRKRSEEDLVALAFPRLKRLAAHGTTTVEVKSGYGLTVEDEFKMLRAIRTLSSMIPLRLVPTFLGAHEIPMEARARPQGREDYIKLLVEEMIPEAAASGLARFVDVFCEPGVFTIEESRRILRSATALGLGVKLHADELKPSGGAVLAAELGAVSADHLGAISHDGIQALAQAPTVATLLPGTLTFLGKDKHAPARTLIDAGAAVALASDFNPGTSPTPNFPLVLTLGVSQLRMSAAEVIVASTVNGAAAVGLASHAGQVQAGFSADLALFDIADFRELAYWYGDTRCSKSWVRGVPMVA